MTADLPTFLEKRRILHLSSGDERRGLADRLIGAGFPDDALDCLQAAGDREGMARLAAIAAESGDPFLLIRIERITGEGVSQGMWESAIAAAEHAGRFTLAQLARRYLATRALS